VPHRKGQTLEEYIAAQYAANPGLKRQVEQLMKQMEREASAAKRKAGRQRRSTTKRRHPLKCTEGPARRRWPRRRAAKKGSS
jgi:hypothetical protein